MKGYVKLMPALILLFVGYMLWSSGIVKYEELDRGYGGISLSFETNPKTIDQLVEIRNQQQGSGIDSSLTAWRQNYNIKIEEPDLGVCVESDLIYMWGDGKGILSTYKDAGCIMSGDKAYELWGSRNVLGKTVYIDGSPCKVTGITDVIDGIIAVRRDDYEKDMKFISLDMEPKSNGLESDVYIENFMLQYSQQADSSINYSDLLSIAGNFMVLPAFAISVYMCGRILRELYGVKKHKKACKFIGHYIVFLLMWLCICFFAGSLNFEIPGSFIPTKWSDFDFWSRVIERLKGGLKGLRLMPVYALDSYFRKSFIYILLSGIMSSACFIAVLKYMRNKNLNRLMAVETVTAFIMFYAAFASGVGQGRYSRAYWFILPVCFVLDYFINKLSLGERT